MKFLKFFLKFLLTVALGGAALAGSLTLLGPASQPLTHATTPIGKLELTINAPPARSLIYDRNGSAGQHARRRGPLARPAARHPAGPDRRGDLDRGPQVLRAPRRRLGAAPPGRCSRTSTRARISQGGSTITQQLVKNTFSVGRKRDLTTKAREAVLAINLEKQLTKSQILVDYLNLVYFGNGAYGVQAAAERYFPLTPLKKLDLRRPRCSRA